MNMKNYVFIYADCTAHTAEDILLTYQSVLQQEVRPNKCYIILNKNLDGRIKFNDIIGLYDDPNYLKTDLCQINDDLDKSKAVALHFNPLTSTYLYLIDAGKKLRPDAVKTISDYANILLFCLGENFWVLNSVINKINFFSHNEEEDSVELLDFENKCVSLIDLLSKDGRILAFDQVSTHNEKRRSGEADNERVLDDPGIGRDVGEEYALDEQIVS